MSEPTPVDQTPPSPPPQAPPPPATPPQTPPASQPPPLPPPRAAAPARAAAPPPRKGHGALLGCLVLVILGSVLGAIVLLAVAFSGTLGSGSLSLGKSHRPEVTEVELASGSFTRRIVVIPVQGVILAGNAANGSVVGSDYVVELLDGAREDKSIVGVILDIDSGGGSVVACDEIYNALQRLRRADPASGYQGKKVVTCMRSLAASGGYYLAAGTDYIVANRLTWTGSIGVIMPGFNYRGLLEDKLGVFSQHYKSGKLKDIGSGARQPTEEEKKVLQGLVDDAFTEFALIVANGRKMPIEKVKAPPIGDARILSGKEAKELGLVDELGYFEQAVEQARLLSGVADARVTRYQPRPTLKDLVFGAAGPVRKELAELLIPGGGLIQAGCPYYLYPAEF